MVKSQSSENKGLGLKLRTIPSSIRVDAGDDEANLKIMERR